jgi:hypothetical protein
MLIAALKKKLKRQVHLWEDEVTSIVFGEMRYLPPADIYSVFSRLIPAEKRLALNWLSELPDRAEFHFWRRRKVEPDLNIDFYLKGQHVASILMEVKWDAGLSPKCELIRQWNDWPHIDIPTIHLYLVKDRAAGLAEIEQSVAIYDNFCMSREGNCCPEDDRKRAEIERAKRLLPGWKRHLHCIGWRDLVSLPKDLSHLSRFGQEWARGVNAFLKTHGLESFQGFDWLRQYPWSSSMPQSFPIFQTTPWFSNLKDAPELPEASSMNLFSE